MTGDESLISVIFGKLKCRAAFDCDQDFDKYGGIILWFAVMIYMFKALGVICDEYFVPSLEVIVEKLQLTPDVAGATFMAAGSSAPELFVSLVATFLLVNEGGVGTIVGSAIFNILVIVGATSYLACKEKNLKIWWYPLCRDCFFYTVSIIELCVTLANEHVEWYEGVIMVLTYLSYCIYMKYNPAIVEALGLVDPEDKEGSSEIKALQASETEPEAVDSDPSALNTVDSMLTNVGGNLRNGATASEGPGPVPPPLLGGPGIVEVPEPSDTKDSREKIDQNGGAQNDQTSSSRPDGGQSETQDQPSSPSGPAVQTVNSLDSPTVTGSVPCEAKFLEPTPSPREEERKRRPSWGFHETMEAQRAASKERAPSKERSSAPGTTQEGEVIVADDTAIACPSQEPERSGWFRDPLVVLWEWTMPRPELMSGGLLFTVAILWIGASTYVMVDATARVGTILHIPTLAMALVFLAAGTSIPDALGSIAVAKQGEGGMAVANAVGSNVFDILIGLGIPWTIKTGIMQKEVSFKGKFDELVWDIVVLIFVLILFLSTLIAQRWHLTRLMGVMLLFFYFLFLVYNVLMVWVFKVKDIDSS
jgi:K+-dependent Na+/Ca+ exchanger-like protein